VSEDTYVQALTALSNQTLVDMLMLIGCYLGVCALLVESKLLKECIQPYFERTLWS
jgi:hypothetical protein